MRRARTVDDLALAAIAAALVLATPSVAEAKRDRAPGTPQRPVLSTVEAARYTPSAYLDVSGPYAAPVADPWHPGPIRTVGVRPDAVVRPGESVQAAVNEAYARGGTARRYIALRPGTHTGTVFVPAGGPPLTLYGIGDARIEFAIDAAVPPAEWAALVNPGGTRYAEGDPAWSMFRSCATRTQATAGLCATVVWSQAPDLQIAGLTLTNTLADLPGTHQALALRTDADRQQVERVRLVSRQDTFHPNTSDATRIARVLVRDSYIEGDTDFVFGRAQAVFERCRFHVVSTRKPAEGVVFAPSTTPLYPFGFLVRHSVISTDSGYDDAPTAHLGRAWDQGAGSTGYVPGVSPNGQLVIRDSVIGDGFATDAPWAAAATTARPFSGNVAPGRNLDDPAFNRLHEYRNVGPGAA
ncbi:pectinesterase [Virgisporangium aliadipatigenens]|uniref:Pectinesterase n=1 Tax=Virgisporangium aliadipatigenens TaxID=741659 RepID=A0A8J3YRS0_9ACTN|nr:pectinesterase family protein [Virgisporangium aliadipatigenens]GIJ48750.1 pectinesterase [Virgisporangium aliadipatigenens]